MRLVVLESPFAGEIAVNLIYARLCVRDCLIRGDAPICSALLYTQEGIFRDDIPAERTRGIEAGHAWIAVAQALVVYTDREISPGMRIGIDVAESLGIPVEYRTLPSWLQAGVAA